MAEKSGFFNSRLINGEWDRKYTAGDYSDNLSVIIGNGVLRSEANDLKVTASGMLVTVAAGRGWINGHYYRNTAAMTLSPVPVASGGSRYDRVVLRMDATLQNRDVRIVYLQGVASNEPQKPALTRTDSVYDLCLADIYVQSGQNYVIAYDTRADKEVCGWVYSVSGDDSFFESLDNDFWTWFNNVRNEVATVTILRKYTQNITLQSPSNQVSFSIPQYEAESCYTEVYINGFYEPSYTIAGTTITFENTLTAGTEITVCVYKNIDGTGLDTIVEAVEELQDAVASMDGTSKFTYKLTGTNDNIALSEIAQAIIDGEYDGSNISVAAKEFLDNLGSSFFDYLNEDAQVTIRVEGQNMTVTTPFAGAGTAASRYRWFSFGQTGITTRKVTFDFEECQNISVVPPANSSNIVFYGTDIHVKNARVSVYTANASVNIDMIASSYANGNITFDDCEFTVLTTGNVTLCQNGTFTNCRAKLQSSGGNCYCFCPKTAGLIRVIGGTFYTYIRASGMVASVFYVASGETNAVAMATNISCPTTAISGYSQQYLSSASTGAVYITGVISTMTTNGNATTIVGQIWKSKH